MDSVPNSGSGHRFHRSILREYDIRGIVGQTLFPADARAIGAAFGTLVRGAGGSLARPPTRPVQAAYLARSLHFRRRRNTGSATRFAPDLLAFARAKRRVSLTLFPDPKPVPLLLERFAPVPEMERDSSVLFGEASTLTCEHDHLHAELGEELRPHPPAP